MRKLILTILLAMITVGVSADNVTPNFATLAPLTSGTIPAAAKGYSVVVINGSATVNGASYKSGQCLSVRNAPTSPVVISTGTGSTLFYHYNQ